MADRDSTFIHTSIWFVSAPGTTKFGQTRRATFPLTDQETANLRAYAQDVAAVPGSGGNRPRLNIGLEWLGASDYTIGSATTSLGYTSISTAEFISTILRCGRRNVDGLIPEPVFATQGFNIDFMNLVIEKSK